MFCFVASADQQQDQQEDDGTALSLNCPAGEATTMLVASGAELTDEAVAIPPHQIVGIVQTAS